jgi:hypothetical protein
MCVKNFSAMQLGRVVSVHEGPSMDKYQHWHFAPQAAIKAALRDREIEIQTLKLILFNFCKEGIFSWKWCIPNRPGV